MCSQSLPVSIDYYFITIYFYYILMFIFSRDFIFILYYNFIFHFPAMYTAEAEVQRHRSHDRHLYTGSSSVSSVLAVGGGVVLSNEISVVKSSVQFIS